MKFFATIFLISLVKFSATQELICDYNLAILPHPNATRCDLYVLCVMYTATIQQCAEGKIFFPTEGADPPNGFCEDGYIETCERLTTPLPTTTTPPPPPPSTTIGISTPSPPPTTTPPPGVIPEGICSGLNFRAIPYPGNCYNYILCVFQRPHLGVCESHQIFLPNWGFCLRGDRETCQPCLFCENF